MRAEVLRVHEVQLDAVAESGESCDTGVAPEQDLVPRLHTGYEVDLCSIANRK